MLKYIPEDIKIIFREIPSEVSLGINLSQCPNNCPYCSEPYLAKNIGDELNIETLLKLININEGITCVCFMGGDNDPDEIISLSKKVKEVFPKLKIGWYSGKDYLNENVKKNLKYFNYIKIGSWKRDLGTLSEKTTNQKFYIILDETLIDKTKELFQDCKIKNKIIYGKV